ncbi:MAG: BolA family transcriptional regulator [Candidatus Contendobacter sp.]|jgi:BolA protein|nr:BolA family transcriptional regulator [Candidatus Contendobacter sp.]
MTDRVALIAERLQTALTPDVLDIIDESLAHAGHVQTREGGHFSVQIVSSAFIGKTLLQRHRLVNAALADLMRQEIHALSITARTPDET